MPNPQRRPDRQERKKAAGRRAFAVLAFLAVVAAAAGYFYLTAHKDARPINEATFCPTDAQGPASVTAILIDKTDTFNPTQQAAIRERLDELKDHTSRYDLFEIYSVDSTQQKVLKPDFSLCNPGRGEDKNIWTGNPQLAEQRWQKLFADPLQHLFDTSLTGGAASISPIMESIQSVVVTRLGAQDAGDEKKPHRLIVISDLLQYVSDYSQYKPLTSFKQFSSLPYYQSVRSDMSGIDVEIWYVRRQNTLHLQGKKHTDFWTEYFVDQGATVDKIWDVPGL
jgi:hypothetical protein